MAKTVLLVPRSEMLMYAKKIAHHYYLDFLYSKVIKTDSAEEEADIAVQAGAEIIIARGLQATRIRNHVSVPVVEILLTGQEMGHLIIKAKAQCETPKPKIGVIGFANMFCDMSSLDELYDVKVQEYFISKPDELQGAVRQAVQDGVEAVIGGDLVCAYAKELDLPSVFQMSSVESIAEAFRVAEHVAYAIELEKKNTAELKTLLDYSFNGIIKLNTEGQVIRANHFIENLLGKSESAMVGLGISELIPPINGEILEQVLVEGKEVYSIAFVVRKTTVVANIAPILFEGRAQGAIVSLHEGRRVAEMEAEMRREQVKKGYVAHYNFDKYVSGSQYAKEVVAKAKNYAKFSAPILMLGSDSTEQEILAQCIHNESLDSRSSFVSLSCKSVNQTAQWSTLFGQKKNGDGVMQKGLLDWAEGGTLFLEHVSCLDAQAQSALYRLLKDRIYVRSNDIWQMPANVRIIASDTPALIHKVQSGEFCRNLFHALNVLPLELPPLEKRTEDVQGWLDFYIAQLEKEHQRYIRFTTDAYDIILHHPWTGGLAQLRSFCERLVILAPRRTVNAATVHALMDHLLPADSPAKESGSSEGVTPFVVRSEQEARLRAALEKHHGKRKMVAEELGVSLTTLWRYMKKYGIYTQ